MANLTQPNDILVATLKNPEISTTDLLRNNINSDNTSFLSYDEYKNTPLVKKNFTKDGVFDEAAFRNAYSLAEYKYFLLSNKKAVDNWSKELEYGATSIYKPVDAKTWSTLFELTTLNNPLGESYSIEGINKKGEAIYTEEEAAQRNRIYDPSTNTWLNDTPESLSLLDKVFGKTLVYAKYDKDIQDPVTGEWHYKGEWKKDVNGNYYTEILDSEELIDKQVVNLSDILTKENSWLNKIDFFDSDGYDKSIAGTAMKTIVQLAPWLIPGFNSYFGAAAAIFGLCSVMPTFYKSFEHLITGDAETFSTEEATRIENWFRKFESSKSRAGRESLWNLESLGQLTTEIFGQLYQLTAAAGFAKYFTDNAVRQTQLGQRLALGYMGLISANDVYNTALQGGYDKRTAGIASLASAGALFGIMNFNETTRGIGTWFLNKTTGTSQEIMRGPAINTAKKLLPEIEKYTKEITKTGSKEAKRNLAQTITKFKRDVLSGIQETLIMPTESLWKSAIVESAEEVSEEVIQDMVKGIIDTMSWLGYTPSNGSFGGWENVFSKEGLERYLATFVGGGLGGAMFHANLDYIQPFFESLKSGKPMQMQKMDYDAYEFVAAGLTDLLISAIRGQKPIINDKFAPTKITLDNGTELGQISPQGTTLADAIIEGAVKYVEALDAAYKQISSLTTDEAERKAISMAWVAQLKDSGFTSNVMVKDYADLCQQALRIKNDLNSLVSTENYDKDREKELKSEFDEVFKKIQGFFSGSNNIKYAIQARVLFDGDIRRAFTKFDENVWLRDVKGINPEDIKDENLKNKLHQEYEQWFSELEGDDASKASDRVAKTVMALALRYGENFDKFSKNKHKKAFVSLALKSILNNRDLETILNQIVNEVLVDDSIKQENKESEIEKRYKLKIIDLLDDGSLLKLIKTNPEAFTLSEFSNFDLAEKLISAGIISFGEPFNSKEILNTIKHLINYKAAQSRILVWNKESIKELLKQVKQTLTQDNIYKQRITEILNNESKLKESKDNQPLTDVALTRIIISPEDFELNDDIESVAINNLEEYVKDSGLDEDNKKTLIQAYKYRLDKELEKLSEGSYLKDAIERFKTDSSDGIYEAINEVLSFGLDDSDPTVQEAEKINKIYQKYQFYKNHTAESNPIRDMLKELSFNLFGEDYDDIFDILEKQELKLQDANRLALYTVGSKLNQIFENITKTISVIKGVVAASKATKDGGGITELAKQYSSFYLNDENLAKLYVVLDAKDAEYIMQYLSRLQNRISSLQRISEENVVDVVIKQKEWRDNYTNALVNWYGQQKGIKLKIGNEEIEILPVMDIPNDKKDYQLFIDECETIIYARLSEYIKTHPNAAENIAKALVEKYNADVQDTSYSVEDAIKIIGENNKDISVKNNFIVRHLYSLTHYSPEQFKNDLKEIYEKNPNTFPAFTLEVAMRQILSYLHNSEIESEIIKAIGIPDPENFDYVGKVLMENTMTIFGPGGAGKTYMLGLIKDKIKEKYGNVEVSAKEQEKLDALKQTVFGDDKSGKALLLDDLIPSEIVALGNTLETKINEALDKIAKFRKSNDESDLDGITKSGNIYTFVAEGIKTNLIVDGDTFRNCYFDTSGSELITNFKIENKAIIIDEATFLNPFLSQVLNEASSKNALIIQVGDVTQMGFSFALVNAKGEEGLRFIFNSQNIQGISVSYLNGSFRFDNDGKKYNLDIFLKALLRLQNEEGQEVPIIQLYKDYDITRVIGSVLTDFFLTEPLIYKLPNERNKEYMGDYITLDVNDFTEKLTQLIQLSKLDNRSIAFVADSEEAKSELKKIISSIDPKFEYKLVSSAKIQGDEADYIIGYRLQSYGPGNNDLSVLKVSMLIGRSRKFGLYFDDSENGIFNTLNIHSLEDLSISQTDSNMKDYSINNHNRRDDIDNELSKLSLFRPADYEYETTEVEEPCETNDLSNENDEDTDSSENNDSESFDQQGQNDLAKESVRLPLTATKTAGTKLRLFLQSSSDTDVENEGISVVHYFYTRLGITREEYNEFIKITNHDALESFLNNHKDSELYTFWSNCDEWKQKLGMQMSAQKDITNAQYFINKFQEFKNRLYSLNNATGQIFAIIGELSNEYDWAYNKPNDFGNSNRGVYLRLAIKVGDRYITIGRLGKNKEDGPSYSKTQDLIYAEASKLILEQSEGAVYVREFTYKSTPDGEEEINEYMKTRSRLNKFNKDLGFLLMYEGLLPASLSEEEVRSANNKDLFGETLDEYGRLTKDGLEKIGITISVPQGGSLFRSEREFLNWYNSFRVDDLDISKEDNKKWVHDLYNRTWFVATLKGTDFSFPILGNLITQFEYKLNNNGNIQLYSIHKALLGAAVLAGQRGLFKNIKSNPITEEDYNNLSTAIDQLLKSFKNLIGLKVGNNTFSKDDCNKLSRDLEDVKIVMRQEGAKLFEPGSLENLRLFVNQLLDYYYEDIADKSVAQLNRILTTQGNTLRFTRVFEAPRFFLVYKQIEWAKPKEHVVETTHEEVITPLSSTGDQPGNVENFVPTQELIDKTKQAINKIEQLSSGRTLTNQATIEDSVDVLNTESATLKYLASQNIEDRNRILNVLRRLDTKVSRTALANSNVAAQIKNVKEQIEKC